MLVRAMLCLLIAGCEVHFGDSDEDDGSSEEAPLSEDSSMPVAMLLGLWMTELDDGLCSYAAHFEGPPNRFLLMKLCSPERNVIQAQIKAGPFTIVSDDELDIEVSESSCPIPSAQAQGRVGFGVESRAAGDRLTLIGADGALVFDRAPESSGSEDAGSLVVVNGCFSSGKFVAMPVAPLH